MQISFESAKEKCLVFLGINPRNTEQQGGVFCDACLLPKKVPFRVLEAKGVDAIGEVKHLLFRIALLESLVFVAAYRDNGICIL
jgi:hypothetical protein